MRFLPVVVLCSALLTGCSSKPDATQRRISIEAETLNQINSELKGKGLPPGCKEVSLVESSQNSYEGYASYTDGTKSNIKVRVGLDGKGILETNPMN